jgi:hypothetical protein
LTPRPVARGDFAGGGGIARRMTLWVVGRVAVTTVCMVRRVSRGVAGTGRLDTGAEIRRAVRCKGSYLFF